MIRIYGRISVSVIAASALVASLLLTGPTTAHAQDSYPNKPVTLVLPWSPGAIVDNVGRRFAQQLTDIWKQTVIVRNEAGGGGNIGAVESSRYFRNAELVDVVPYLLTETFKLNAVSCGTLNGQHLENLEGGIRAREAGISAVQIAGKEVTFRHKLICAIPPDGVVARGG